MRMRRWLLILVAFLLSALPAASREKLFNFSWSAAGMPGGGTCPTGANYLSTDGQSLVTLATLGITNCFFISKSGTASNSNNGTSESTEWTAMPGMPSCTATCASHTPAAGEGYIFRGGDTWGASDLEYIYSGSFGSGTASNPVYIGVDQTWFTGASWTRPVFSCAGATCSTNTKGHYFTMGNTGTQFIIIDNFEFTGLHTATEQQYISLGGSHDIVENNYFHGWDHVGAASDSGQAVATQSSVQGDALRFNVCDGSDTTKDMMGCHGSTNGATAWKQFYGNVSQWVVNGQNGSIDTAHDNFTAHIVNSFNPGHANAWQITGSTSTTNVTFYCNLLTDVQNGGDGQYWWGQGDNSGNIWYEFDNIEYATAAGNNINFSQNANGSGTHFCFNNTLECGSVANGLNPCINGAGVVHPLNLHLLNDHCIASTTNSCSNGVGSGLTLSESNSLVQSLAQANANSSPHFDQYTESQTFAFSPVAATNSTVGAGLNEQSLCSTISAFDTLAGVACQDDTGYACTYNTSNHTVTCPQRTKVPRPALAPWDIGAFQFSSSGPPSPPGTLTVTATNSNPPYQTVLSWVASSTGGVTYNIYRTMSVNNTYTCPTIGTWPRLATGVASTTFTDNSLGMGVWCYEITAVSSGGESAPDTPVPVVVPPQIIVTENLEGGSYAGSDTRVSDERFPSRSIPDGDGLWLDLYDYIASGF